MCGRELERRRQEYLCSDGSSRSVREGRDGWKRQNGAEAAGKLHLLLVTYLEGVRGGTTQATHTTNHLPHTGTHNRHGGKPLPTCITSHVHREQRSIRRLMQQRGGTYLPWRALAHSSCNQRHQTRKRTWAPADWPSPPISDGEGERDTTSPRAHKLLTYVATPPPSSTHVAKPVPFSN